MSLLLDARKKSQQAQPSQQGDPASRTSESGPQNQSPETVQQARSDGQNLFAAKSLLPFGGTLPNRNLLYALGGTVLLLAAGMVYLWYASSASSTTPLRSATPPAPPVRQMPPVAGVKPAIPPAAETAKPASADIPEKPQSPAAASAKSILAAPPQPHASARQDNIPIRIEQQKTEPVDPLLRDAYLAYSSGKLGEAQQLYLAMLRKDEHNADALLGLAAIAQERGENPEAAQYFGRVLVLDPRNAVANAGMAGLNADDDHNESRLRTLLREQGNSAALHFALGNLYAGQSRWGEAQQAYFNAYTLESGNAEYAFNLAVSLDHLGQKKLAVQHYQRAMQLDPSHSAGFDHAQTLQRVQELTR